MKILSMLFILNAILLNPIAAASGDHHHVGGPKGGRLLEHTNPQAEFFLEKDRTATITFYDEEMKPVSAENQSIQLIAEKDGVKTKLEFEKKGEMLASKGALPEGANLVVQFKQTPEAKPKNYRFALKEEICKECKRSEYACICGH